MVYGVICLNEELRSSKHQVHLQNEGKKEKAAEEEVQWEAKREALRKREAMLQASWKVRLKGVLKPNLVLVVIELEPRIQWFISVYFLEFLWTL